MSRRVIYSAATLLLVVLAVEVRSQDTLATAKEALAALALAEAKVPRGRLTFTTTERRATLTEKLDEAARSRIIAAPGAVVEGTLVFGPEGWLRDLTVPSSGTAPRAMRLRTAEGSGVLRNLMEVKPEGGAPEAYARVLKVPITAPADALLTRRAGPLLMGVEWSAARAEGDGVVMEGRRFTERHTLTLRRSPQVQVRRWVLVRKLTSPEGEAFDQTYELRVEGNEQGLTRVDEWLTGGGGGAVTFRRTAVTKLEETPAATAADLQLRFPKGAHVVDVRHATPVEYEQTAEGINDADVTEAARVLAQGRTRVGQPAPDFLFPDGKGKPVKLTDMLGQVVVLFWFAPGSRAAREAAPAIQALSENYKKRRVRVVGLLVGDNGDGADAFRKQYKWSFSVCVDAEGEAMHRFGILSAVPKIAVIDRTGKLAYAEPGADMGAVTALLDRLAEKP